MHGDFEFVAPYFDGVSTQAKDLICKMLVVDSRKRMSADVRSLLAAFVIAQLTEIVAVF